MHAVAATLAMRVVQGPMAWAQATRARIEALPGEPAVEPAVKLSRRGGESALGMCGVLRPITSLESFNADVTPVPNPA